MMSTAPAVEEAFAPIMSHDDFLLNTGVEVEKLACTKSEDVMPVNPVQLVYPVDEAAIETAVFKLHVVMIWFA